MRTLNLEYASQSKENAAKEQRKGSRFCHVFACINFRFTSGFEAAEMTKVTPKKKLEKASI
jgi:hypothetical protein